MKPIVFLDIDGVLNNTEWDRTTSDDRSFDPISLLALSQILSKSGADVIISSSWRKSVEDSFLAALIESQGCPINVVGHTPLTFGMHRGNEIGIWLDENGVDRDTGNYLIIDDDTNIGDSLAKHWVQTCEYEGGLRLEHVEAALAILRVTNEDTPADR